MRRRFTKPNRMLAGLLTGLLLAILPVPLSAQPAESPAFYDVAREVTLRGTVSSVQTAAAARSMAGSRLRLSTASGVVEADLGRWGLRGKGSLSVAAGQQVEVTGVMKTLGGKQIFLVRTVKASGQIYTIRNEHGISVSPQARERASQKAAQKGQSL
jgi:hypothetical protein